MPPALLTPTRPHVEPPEDATRREFIHGVGAAALAAAFLAACGDDDDDAESSATPEPASRLLQDLWGDAEIPSIPMRVIAADTITLASMYALGVKPVGAAFNRNVAPPFPTEWLDGVADVTGEANNSNDIEKVLTAEPDLVVRYDFPWNDSPSEQCELLKQAVPTYCYPYGFATEEELRRNLTEVARALGMEERGQEVLDEYDARVADLRERVVAAGLSDAPVSVVRLSSDGNYRIPFGYSEGIAFRALGIAQPEGQQDPHEHDGALSLSLENLHVLNAAHTLFLYEDSDSPGEIDAIENQPLWQGLEPVRAERVHRVDAALWVQTDIVSVMSMFDDIERYFIEPAEASM